MTLHSGLQLVDIEKSNIKTIMVVMIPIPL